MATRFYLRNPAGGAPAVSHAFSASWQVSSSAQRATMDTTKAATTGASCATAVAAVEGDNCLAVQFVSGPLAAQTISGTVKGQLGARSTGDLDAMSQVVIRVIADDGTVRGTLVAAQAEALSSEWSTSPALVNRRFPLSALSPLAVASVIAQDGDRLVVETGAKIGVTGGSSPFLRAQDNQASDLPEDETTSSASFNSWIEFSADILAEGQVAGSSAGGVGVGIGVGL